MRNITTLLSLQPESDLRTFLTALVSRPEWEREWLELLSQLEYVGCRKIVKAVPYAAVNLEVLQHLAEEASHAFLIKSVIAKLDWPERSWTQGALGEAGWRYFQTLDEEVSEFFPGGSAYPAVSWIVEQRVLVLYPLYTELTSYPQVKRVLTTIVAQEERHGKQFESLSWLEPHRDKMISVEARLWARFQSEVSEILSLPLPTLGANCQRSQIL